MSPKECLIDYLWKEMGHSEIWNMQLSPWAILIYIKNCSIAFLLCEMYLQNSSVKKTKEFFPQIWNLRSTIYAKCIENITSIKIMVNENLCSVQFSPFCSVSLVQCIYTTINYLSISI